MAQERKWQPTPVFLPGESHGPRSLAGSSQWGCKKLDMTEGLTRMAQIVKNPLAMRDTWVRSLGWDDPLEEVTATHSSVPAWRIPWTEEPGGLQSMVSQKV